VIQYRLSGYPTLGAAGLGGPTAPQHSPERARLHRGGQPAVIAMQVYHRGYDTTAHCFSLHAPLQHEPRLTPEQDLREHRQGATRSFVARCMLQNCLPRTQYLGGAPLLARRHAPTWQGPPYWRPAVAAALPAHSSSQPLSPISSVLRSCIGCRPEAARAPPQPISVGPSPVEVALTGGLERKANGGALHTAVDSGHGELDLTRSSSVP